MDKKRMKKVTFALVLSVLMLISLLMLTVFFAERERPELLYYFEEDFHTGLGNWKAVDTIWNEKIDGKQGIINLVRKETIAPNAMLSYPLDNAPQKSFVWHFTFSAEDFTDETVVLGALFLPTGPVAIVLNDDGKIGIAKDLFEEPYYSNDLLNKVTKDQWHDLKVYFDAEEKVTIVYLDDKQILKRSLTEETYLIQDIWLGAVWLKGTADYGAPLNVKYDRVAISNEALVPKPSLFEFLRVKISSIF